VTPSKINIDGHEKLTPLKTPQNIIDDEDSAHDSVFERKLAHLLFLVGQITMKILVFSGKVENELKKLKIEGEKK